MFNEEKARLPINFIELLKHGDDFYGQPFTLLKWQSDVISEFYGEIKKNGYRRYQYLYLEIPKKNGKSELAAALGLYHLVAEGQMNGEIYIVAADKENAGIIYRAAVSMIEQNEYLTERLKIRESRKEIIDPESKSFIKVMSSEAYSKHGYKPTVVIFDELHAQPNRELWDILTFGAGSARKQPVWIVLTTAGDDPDKASIGWEVHEYARKVIEKEIDDTIWLARIFCAPETADIWSEEVWYQANPSLGHTIDIEKVRQEALSARNSPALEKKFRWLRLNQWVELKSFSWLPLTLFDSTAGSWSSSELIGKKCYLGLDLSSTTDLTALVLLFPPQDGFNEWRVLFLAWIPSESMREREHIDHVPYSRWVKQKYIEVTPGDVVDYEYVETAIIQAFSKYDVISLGTDQWNSRNLTQRVDKQVNEHRATSEKIPIVEIPQSMAGMSLAMKETERLLKTGEMSHEINDCARWNFGNVKVSVDGNENMKPMKNKSTGRIDITVAWINAVAVALLLPIKKKSVYEERGVRVI